MDSLLAPRSSSTLQLNLGKHSIAIAIIAEDSQNPGCSAVGMSRPIALAAPHERRCNYPPRCLSWPGNISIAVTRTAGVSSQLSQIMSVPG